jgi:hypothetical protein
MEKAGLKEVDIEILFLGMNCDGIYFSKAGTRTRTEEYSQCFGYGSGLGRPVDPGSESGSGSRRAKIYENVMKFHVLKCSMFSLRAEGLDVIYGGLGIRKFNFG